MNMGTDQATDRIARLRSSLRSESVGALLVSHLPNIRYLTAFSGTAGYLLITRDEARLFVDPRYTEQARAQVAGAEVQETSCDVLGDVLAYILEHQSSDLAVEAERLSTAHYLSIRERLHGRAVVPSSNVVERLRYLKDAGEVASLSRAVEIADAAFDDFLGWFRPGMTERAVAAQLEFFQRNLDSDRKPSETVVASGPRTGFAHGIATGKRILPDEPVMIDIGCVVGGYTSDLTRTVHLGTPDPDFAAIHEIVLEAMERAKAGIRPGLTGKEVDALARDHIVERGYGDRFGHALGHSVGLEIHERPNFSTAEEIVIEPGMVLTVEPGIYLPGRFGVRTEDIVLVTDSGCEVLTGSPLDLKVV